MSLSQAMSLQGILSSEEQIKLNRFHFKTDSQRYLVSHVFLRLYLSEFLNTKPESIKYDYLEFSKPILKDNTSVHFNLSHSYDRALIGIVSAPIGWILKELKA